MDFYVRYAMCLNGWMWIYMYMPNFSQIFYGPPKPSSWIESIIEQNVSIMLLTYGNSQYDYIRQHKQLQTICGTTYHKWCTLLSLRYEGSIQTWPLSKAMYANSSIMDRILKVKISPLYDRGPIHSSWSSLNYFKVYDAIYVSQMIYNNNNFPHSKTNSLHFAPC